MSSNKDINIKYKPSEDVFPEEITFLIYKFVGKPNTLKLSKKVIGLLIPQCVFKKDAIVYALTGDIQDLYFAFWYKIKKDININTVQKWIDNIYNIPKIEIIYYLFDILSQYRNIDVSILMEYVLINHNEDLIQKVSGFMDFKLADNLYRNPEMESNSRYHKKISLYALRYSSKFVYPTSINFIGVVYDNDISKYFTDLMKYSNIESIINFYQKFKRAIIEVEYYNRRFIFWLIDNDPECVIYLFNRINFIMFIFNDLELLEKSTTLNTIQISENIKADEDTIYACFKVSASNIQCFNILIYFLTLTSTHQQYIFEDISFNMCFCYICENENLKLEVVKRMFLLKPHEFRIHELIGVAILKNNLKLYKFMENYYKRSIYNFQHDIAVIHDILSRKSSSYCLLEYLINTDGNYQFPEPFIDYCKHTLVCTDNFSKLPDPDMMNILINCSMIIPEFIRKILHGIQIFSDLFEKNI